MVSTGGTKRTLRATSADVCCREETTVARRSGPAYYDVRFRKPRHAAVKRIAEEVGVVQLNLKISAARTVSVFCN